MSINTVCVKISDMGRVLSLEILLSEKDQLLVLLLYVPVALIFFLFSISFILLF